MEGCGTMIFASGFAALVGKNPYKHPSQEIYNIWKRYNNEKVVIPETSIHRRIENEAKPIIEKVISKMKDNESIITNLQEPSKIKELDVEIDQMIGEAILETSPDISEKVSIAVKSKATMQYGKMKEPAIRDSIKAKDGNDKFIKRKRNDFWSLGGRIDGFDEDGNIVEIKNRRWTIKTYPPEYDIVQLLCYLWITEKKIGYLEERLNNADCQKVTTITLKSEEFPPGCIRGDHLWEECLSKMDELAPVLSSFLHDDSKQQIFIDLFMAERYEEALISLYQ